jgi:hypothetical protein
MESARGYLLDRLIANGYAVEFTLEHRPDVTFLGHYVRALIAALCSNPRCPPCQSQLFGAKILKFKRRHSRGEGMEYRIPIGLLLYRVFDYMPN